MDLILLLGMPGGWEILFILIILAFPGLLWIWALVDALKSEFTDSSNKLIWVLLILLLPILGAFLYLVIGRGQRKM